jgi:hypothetical protein
VDDGCGRRHHQHLAALVVRSPPRGTHLLLGGLISFFTATMICVIALLDNPYRGEVGISPEAFELIYDQLMAN